MIRANLKNYVINITSLFQRFIPCLKLVCSWNLSMKLLLNVKLRSTSWFSTTCNSFGFLFLNLLSLFIKLQYIVISCQIIERYFYRVRLIFIFLQILYFSVSLGYNNGLLYKFLWTTSQNKTLCVLEIQ